MVLAAIAGTVRVKSDARGAVITSQDIRWWRTRAKDEATSLALMSRIEMPSDVSPRFKNVRRIEVMVPMRDGVRLATDVYLPLDPLDGSPLPTQTGLPAIIVRQPYGKRAAFLWMPVQGRYWARRGYACVIQDVRGRWGSEGAYDPFVTEVDDGYDTMDWVARQPWCDGTLGAMGESYFGYTTWAMAVAGHPALRAAVPGDTTTDMYASAFRNGALCYNPFGVWALWVNGRRFRNYYRADSYHLPLHDLDDASGLSSRPWKMLLAHFPKDEYWDRLDLTPRLAEVTVPVMQWSGWYDQFLSQTIAHWRDMRTRRAAESDQFLVLGATDHMLSLERSGRIGRLPVAGHGHWNDRICRFFDRHLRGAETEFPAAPVTYFTIGREEWRTAAEWPPQHVRAFELYLSGAGRGATGGSAAKGGAGRGGSLLPAPPPTPASRAYTYDPQHPLDAWVGTDGWAPARDLRDRAPYARRADVLTFDSPPLAADLEITGPLTVTLFAASSAEDTDFIATLDDLFPDGYVHLVQQGIVRARYRNTGRDEPLEPGKTVEYAIDLWATSHLVRAGHRLRLEISSSEFDRYDRNLNVYEPWGTGCRPRTALQTVYLGGDTPTHLTFRGPNEPAFRG
jgi:putative CocE/NonD family hydrolase